MKKLLYLFSFLLAVTFAACENGQPEGPSNPTGPSNPDEPSEPNKHENHEWVDLGLSVKWATCNVGANAPEEFGDYFAWGETQPKEVYDWSTYKWTKLNSEGDIDSLIRYNFNKAYGVVDSISTLFPEDDAAIVNLGKDWRMPTKAEIQELIDKCNWKWTTQNGVNGYKVTGPSGNHIFLPHTERVHINNEGYYSCYWTSQPISPGSVALRFNNEIRELIPFSKDNACAIRPVRSK